MKRSAQVILGGLFFAIQLLAAAAGIYQSFTTPIPPSDMGWKMSQKPGRLLVESVDGAGPAASLRAGDEVIAIAGQPVKDSTTVVSGLQHLNPGTMYSLIVRRDGRLQEFNLRTEATVAVRVTLMRLAYAIILAIFLITGLAVFCLRPHDKPALLLGLMFGMVSTFFTNPGPGLPGSMLGAVIISRLVSTFLCAVFFHFFLTFPEPSRVLRRFPKIEFYIYLPFILTSFPYYAGFVLVGAFWPQSLPAFESNLAFLGRIGGFLDVIYIAGGLLTLLANYRHASRPARRKMRVVVAGSVAGTLPPLLLIGASALFDLPNSNPTLLHWLFWIVLMCTPVFPLSFAYAIVRHQVIPVRLMLRRGVRYVFVSQGSIVLEMVAVFVALIFLLYSFLTYLQPTNVLVIGVISGVVSIVVWEITGLLHRHVIAPAIDRRFFRQAYNAQQVLSDLGSALRSMTDIQEMASLACSKIQDALHTENVRIFFPESENGRYYCAASSEFLEQANQAGDDERGLRFPHDSIAVDRLLLSASPLAVDFQDPRGWAQRIAQGAARANQSRQLEYETLRQARTALLVPIATKDHLHGIVSLGPRLGDLPFSREDKQLLLAVAWQMAFAIENSQLVIRMAEEERLRLELNMAAEVQRRIFPEEPPVVPSLDLWGVCHAARGVGGDYYDFLVLDQGRVGIAVADVAGKGISAALLMSIVQASLRSQAPAADGRLTDLVASMNRLLHRSTGASGFASFFYAQFDEQSGMLTYVNAGHNPPILARAGSVVRGRGSSPLSMARAVGGSPDLGKASQPIMPLFGKSAAIRALEPQDNTSPLTTGGVVIGLFEDSQYEQETVQMRSGDLLVAYTDGVTESLSPEGEEFGESRLRRLVVGAAHLPAAELSDHVVQTVRDWSKEMPQQDDMTLVIMKVK
jgi:sigma-B regulation protein RsbU (phosphoserine phosphatase)